MNQPTTILHTGFSMPELEKEIITKHIEIKEYARKTGRDRGQIGQPPWKGEILEVHTGSINTKYEEIATMVKGRVQAESTEREIKALKETTDEKLIVLNKNKLKAENSLFNFENDYKHNGGSLENLARTEVKPTAKTFGMALIVIGVAEWLFTASGIEGIGDNYLFALGISAGITVALYYLAQYIGKHLKEFGKGRDKTIITAIACIVAIAIFFALAILRSKVIKDQDEIAISPFFLVLFNVLFFGVTVWFFYRDAITPEAKKEQEELLKYKKQWEALKAQLLEMENQIKALKEERTEKLNLLMLKPGYVKYLIQRIEHWRKEAIDGFIEANISARPDQKVPECILNYKKNKKNG